MIPTTPQAKTLYLETRDYRNRWRQANLKRLNVYVLESVLNSAELAQFQEDVDFATSEGILNLEQIAAAQRVEEAAKAFRELLKGIA